uniref:Uncharacterized protein n=1 Tax=Podoviridae sp. ct90d35 TaxID=2827724 RepID=A0A8S5TNF8_9CAUD|nr:MAG TPA: hypothetical protein [Podoviridae sp. ct90d35]
MFYCVSDCSRKISAFLTPTPPPGWVSPCTNFSTSAWRKSPTERDVPASHSILF